MESEIKRNKDEPATGFSVNVTIKSIEEREDNLIIKYEYNVIYGENVASMKIVGEVVGSFENSKEILKEWEESKKKNRPPKLPQDFSEEILNAINYACSINGTILARVINLAPPVILPRLQISRESEERERKGKGM